MLIVDPCVHARIVGLVNETIVCAQQQGSQGIWYVAYHTTWQCAPLLHLSIGFTPLTFFLLCVCPSAFVAGHIGFLVDDVYGFSSSLEKAGVPFQKKPDVRWLYEPASPTCSRC